MTKKNIFNAEKYFDSIDKDRDGFLAPEEVKRTLVRSGMPVSPALLRQIISNLDQNGDGKISKAEFVNFAKRQDEKLLECFDHVDVTRTGKLNAQDIGKVLQELGMPATNDVIQTIIMRMD